MNAAIQGPAVDTIERRRHPRVPLSRPIYVEFDPGRIRRTRAVNLSYSGIGILCNQPLPMGLTVTLRFTVGVRTLQEDLVIRACVRQVLVRDDLFVMGLEFVEAGNHELERVRELVEHKLKMRAAQGLA